jgi:opacity protein-like surface antigen
MKKFLLLFLFSCSLFAQTNNDYLVITKLNVGTAFSPYTSWYFTDLCCTAYKVNLGYSVGVGFESPDLLDLYNARLSSEIGITYGHASTGEISKYSEKAKFTLTSLPVMVWAKLKTTGTIVPYVKIGIGAERTEFIESYSIASQENFDIKQWFFSWGAGAGIDINCNKNMVISLFVDSIIKERGISKTFDDRRATLAFDFRSCTSFLGVQFGYKL